jgi:NAD-dependent deacetylase
MMDESGGASSPPFAEFTLPSQPPSSLPGASAQYPTPLPADPAAVANLRDLVQASRRIVAFTGAGISTESGIPDYRGPGGVWSTGKPPTLDEFVGNETVRREYWLRRREQYPQMAGLEPNAGHRALVTLERGGRLLGIVTQNIDGLHQKAGSDPGRVVELHGTSHQVRCLACGTTWDAADVQRRLASEPLPTCTVCGGHLRSATVLFGEAMPMEPLRQAIGWAGACDLMLVVGSSLVVQPAARIPVLAKQAGAALAMVNREPTPLDGAADVVVIGDAGPALAAVAAAVEAARQVPGGSS